MQIVDTQIKLHVDHAMGPGYATSWQIGFQDAASPMMEGILNLHNDLLAFMVSIIIFVVWLLGRAIVKYNVFNTSTERRTHYNDTDSTLLEVVWTLAPSFILLAVAIPSFALLYATDEVVDPALTIKAIGHQWYWSYEYSDYADVNSANKHVSFDSFLIPEDDLALGELRLLEVDHQLFVPTNTHIRILVTSTDVLHSWSVPALGVKMDACPGRLNQTSIYVPRTGIYYGQCSEICGVNHGFMPIAVKAVELPVYIAFIAMQ
jgi:cytochrome c oxidase subunit 2